nr:hypothetical protein [Desulfobacula sp.]
MKITDPGVIKSGEKDLIELLKEDLDLDVVREIIKKKMTAAALSPRGGEIVVHNNQIAFRMDFDLCLSGSLMFDRQGNHLPEEDEDIGTGEKTETGLLDYDLDHLDGPNDPDNLDALDNMDELDELYELDDPGNLDEPADDPEPGLELREDDAPLMADDLADDDITDILKESRDFWEQKKDS